MIELNRIYNEDCLEGMKKIDDHSIDCIICDLPYNITSMSWDSLIPFDKLWEQYNRIIKPNGNIILFSSGMFTFELIKSNMKNFKYRLIWKKNVPTGMASSKYRPMKYFEEICVFNYGKAKYNPIMKERVGLKKACYNYNHYCGKNNHLNLGKKPKKYDPNYVQPSDVLEFNVVPNRNKKLHPTQKPVDLTEWLIKTYTNEGDIVLDNCTGSGTTAIAAMNTGRKFIGFELDKTYFDIDDMLKIGPMEHERWLQEHIDMGWRCDPDISGDERELKRLHKDMISKEELGDGLTPEKALAHYKKLSKEEQDKDVEPMNTMLTLLKLFDGVRIYRLN